MNATVQPSSLPHLICKIIKFFVDSLGKGLGAQEDGETQNIKVKVKNDKQGIGANLDYSDTWLDHQDDFNSVLAALNTCHSAPGSGTATPPNEVKKKRTCGVLTCWITVC